MDLTMFILLDNRMRAFASLGLSIGRALSVDDGVYVNATESDIKASQRIPVQKCTFSSQEEVLVFGGYVTYLTTNTITLQEEMNN